jgi:putative transcription antitermination factor YqgF
MIEFKNITQKYGQTTVISNISFTVDKGSLVVLIGPSGCGKTTLLKMINRLITPTAGDIFINGRSVFKQDAIQLRRNIGYVIQQTGLFPHMTVRENIEIIPRLQKKKQDEITKKSISLMEMVGLNPDAYLDRYPFQLSGGQQQRIGVASGDLTVRIASPLPSIMNDEQVFQKVVNVAARIQAEAIVIGLPRDISGEETGQAQVSRDFASALARVTDRQIIFQDESLTSVLAEEKLRVRKGFSEKMLRDGTLDSEAAALILQDFLERGGNGIFRH